MSIQELKELSNDVSYSFENTITLENRPPLRFPKRTASLDLLEVCELYEDVEFEEEKVEGNWIVDLLTLDDLKSIHQDFLEIPEQKVDQNQLKSLLVHYNPNLDWPDDEFMLVFLKMDGDFDGYCDWADFIAYLLYEFHSKESLATTDHHQLELPINENPIILPSKHRHPIISVLFRPYVYKDRTWDFDNGKYITISTDGAMNIWTLDFELEKSQYAYYPKEAKVQKTFVTSVVILADCNIICMATRERDLRFYDISLGNFYLRTQIVGLHQTITALNYYFHSDCEKSSLLIGGDFVGNILYFKFKPKNGGPFRTLSQNTRSGFFQIKRLSLENAQIPGLKFRMFEGFQSDWIHQIEWYPSYKTILSCQNRGKNSLISLDPSSKGIRIRFNIPKGVNVFCVVKDVEPNLFVTGGYDRAIRVWNHTDSFEPLAVLKGHRSPIAAIVVQNKGARIYSLSVDKVFKVWDPKQKTCIMTVSGKLSDLESDVPFTCFYNPVYRRFIAANTKIFLLRLGHAVNLYYTEGYTHVAGVTKALFNPIFKCVVTVGMDSNILTWDPYNGKRTHMIQNAHTKKQYGETLTVGITSATFGPSWIHLLTGAVDGSVKMWNFTLGICLREMMMEQDCCVTGLYWIPQRLLAMGWNKHVTEWVDEVEIGDSKHWPTYHTEDITASAICTPDVIATGTYSGELIFLKLKNGQPFKIHFVGSPNLDNKIGFALNRGYPLKLTSSTEKMIGQVPCYCTEEKPCDCTWKCRCLENCDCLITNRCKCDQTIFFMKEAKEMEDLESMFDGVFGKNEKEVQRSKSAKSQEEKKKKKKAQSQPMFGRIAGRMEIHAMYFLQTRDDLVKTGSLLTSLQNGWIQLWSRNVDGGLVSSFYAIHVVGDYVTAMTSNSDDSFLFTGHAFGYVKIWEISNFGRDGPPIKKCMPILRLRFPFLINDKIPGRAKRAARGQIEPMILSSCRNHVSKVSHIELIEGNEIYITCGLDKAVRFWSYGGQYIGTLGSVLPWPKILPNTPFKPWPLRIPPDLKRVVSSTSLKVLTDCWAEEKKVEQKSNKSDLFSSDEDDEKRYKKQIEASELNHKIYPDCLKEPVLGKYFKLTELNVTVKQPPKLNLQDPVPKRNIRIRGVGEVEEADSDQNEECHTLIRDTKPKKALKTTHQPLLSFEEDLNEGDDGEVFKVKKSSQSKKIKKKMDKERKKKKDKPEVVESNIDTTVTSTVLNDDIVIKLKNTFPILNGKEAEAAVQEGISSEEEEDVNVHKFTKRQDSFKLLLERGKIPDAATIHAARKQRQHVREMGEIVPVPDENARFENAQSRLVREDDNDGSDGEEERLNMAVNLANEDRIRRKAEFEAAQEFGSEESDKGEEEEWEQQQIRKGVTGAQIAAVQQETMYYQQYLGSNSMEMEREESRNFNLSSTGLIDPKTVVSKLKERLSDLKEVHRRHTLDRERSLTEIDEMRRECAELKGNAPKLAERFRFYQDLRGYVTDLVECLDEKIMIVQMLENRVEALFAARNAEYVNRRRNDVTDQSQELNSIPSLGRGRSEKDEAQVRRIAEREGRRIRRQRARELKGIVTHIEGMSSDEEITETEIVTARTQRETIEKDAKQVFEDTLHDFSTIECILERFEKWRKHDMDAYTEAYVSLCIPKLLGPFIRLQLLFWNPFTQGNNDLEKSSWCNSVVLYGLDSSETEESLKNDPDVQLLPRIVEKIILPKLTQLASLCWDPLSNSQSIAFVSLVTKLIQDYPTITHSSKFLTNLVNVIIEKMKEAVEKDIFIPIYPLQKMAEPKANGFFSRQCTVAIKLLGNIVRWQGILSDTALSDIALNSLLNRYLLSAMRTCHPVQAANLCQMIGSVLPRVWLQICVHPPQLAPFLNEARSIARQLDIDKPYERDALERMSAVLKAIAA